LVLKQRPGEGRAAPEDGVARQYDVELVAVSRSFGNVVAVDDLTLRVEAGSFFSLLGPSGCGKTTTLRLIAGFEQPDVGEIFIDGASVVGVPAHKRNVNTVFQHYALFPHLDVADNVAYGLKQLGVEVNERKRRAAEALELVRLTGYEHRRTWQLSGGQQQRVALARALVNKPTVLLLDEPLGALDLKLRKAMQHELKALQLETGITFVYVTHDQEEALTMSDRLAVLRAGRIRQEGTPREIYEAPVERYVADFVGISNFFTATVEDTYPTITARTASGQILTAVAPTPTAGITRGSSVTVAVRPERVRLERAAPGDGTQGVEGRLVEVTFLGEATEYRVATPALGDVLARRQNSEVGSGTLSTRLGDTVWVSWEKAAALAMVPED
jgi:spermidine/putrescine transport system ATP-binding protein